MLIWLLEAIGASQDAKRLPGTTASDAIQVLQEPSLVDDPRFSRIKIAVVFTQKLMLTYHAVILGAVIAYAIARWAEKLRRPETREVGSVAKKFDEATPLIEAPIVMRLNRPQQARRWIAHIRGFLMYQPGPIPLIGKPLPSNKTSLVLLVLIAANVFYLFFNCPLHGFGWNFMLGERAAALFVANLPLLYLVAAKNQPLSLVTGVSYESLNIVHRRLGEWMCLLALVHGSCMLSVWYTILRPLAQWPLAFYLSRPLVILGLCTLISYELLFLPAMRCFRQRCYEWFLASHVILHFLALAFVFFHHPRSRIYVGIVLGIFVMDRLVFRAGLRLYRTEATLTILDDQDSVKIEAKWPLYQPSTKAPFRAFLKSVKHGWRPAEHVFITLPELSRLHRLQAHPFSIMSPPPSSSDSAARLELLVRAQTGFSRDVLNYARSHPNKPVKILFDGAYGSNIAFQKLSRSDTVIAFAGGSGLSVTYPLISALVSHQQGIVCQRHGVPKGSMSPTTATPKRICLLWTFRFETQKSWMSPEYLELLHEAGVQLVMPPPTSTHGRPALDEQLREFLGLGGDGNILNNGRISVLSSGPDEMNREIRNCCASLVSQYGLDINVVVEKFGW